MLEVKEGPLVASGRSSSVVVRANRPVSVSPRTPRLTPVSVRADVFGVLREDRQVKSLAEVAGAHRPVPVGQGCEVLLVGGVVRDVRPPDQHQRAAGRPHRHRRRRRRARRPHLRCRRRTVPAGERYGRNPRSLGNVRCTRGNRFGSEPVVCENRAGFLEPTPRRGRAPARKPEPSLPQRTGPSPQPAWKIAS